MSIKHKYKFAYNCLVGLLLGIFLSGYFWLLGRPNGGFNWVSVAEVKGDELTVKFQRRTGSGSLLIVEPYVNGFSEEYFGGEIDSMRILISEGFDVDSGNILTVLWCASDNELVDSELKLLTSRNNWKRNEHKFYIKQQTLERLTAKSASLIFTPNGLAFKNVRLEED